ncbi:MAG: hypothetical protein K8S56_01250, partial [Candidatus Cloacimonetes bacterium]|nr:hypothetical protein [Candidatus Cloacimonadota bacterium]
MQLIIFDECTYYNFFPITMTRSTGDLRTGILKLRQRIQAYFEHKENAVCINPVIEGIYRERHPDWQINRIESGEALLVNSRVKINDKLVKKIRSLKPGNSLANGYTIIAAKLSTEQAITGYKKVIEAIADCTVTECDCDLWCYIWELIDQNGTMIKQDFKDFFYEKDNHFETEPGVTILDPYNVWLGEGVKLKPGVVIDDSEGPIVLDEGVRVLSNSVLTGPLY